MRRRTFMSMVCAGAALPMTVRAQQPTMPIIGVLRVGARDVNEAFLEPFPKYMRALGWQERRNIGFQFVWANGQADQLPVLARELVARQVNLIITFGNPAVRAVQRATTTIPIIGMADDLVRAGLAASMARPGGNTTGVSILGADLDSKRHELLHEFVPYARRIAVLADPEQFTTRTQLENASRALGLDLSIYTARSREEIGNALDGMEKAEVQAANVLASPVLNGHRAFIIDRLLWMRLPAIYEWPESAVEGGFLGYGPSLQSMYRQVSVIADKVLRGAAPGDLPIEQPTKIQLVVNLRTASAIGLTIPAVLLLRADEVIE